MRAVSPFVDGDTELSCSRLAGASETSPPSPLSEAERGRKLIDLPAAARGDSRSRRQLLSGNASQMGDCFHPVVGMGVDTGPHRTAAQPQLA